MSSVTQAKVEEAEAIFKRAMKESGLIFDHYGILEKAENNVYNVGLQPWLALTLSIIRITRSGHV